MPDTPMTWYKSKRLLVCGECQVPAFCFPADVGSEDDPESPHAYVYGYDGTDPDAAKAHLNYETYGALNHFAAYEWPVCPTGWHAAWAED